MKFQNSVDTTRPRWWPRRPRSLSRGLVIVAVVLSLALPMGVAAGHRFTDVPGTNPFHAAIDAIARAGITGGCTSTTYCPDQAVTRGQMGAFMHRGLGRIATTVEERHFPDGQVVTSPTVDINVGGVAGTGNKQYVKVDAVFIVHVNNVCTSAAPCNFEFRIVEPASNKVSEPYKIAVTEASDLSGYGQIVTLSAVFDATPGTHGYGLRTQFLPHPSSADVNLAPIRLTATTYPFLEGSNDVR